jgi:hypothetical protein
MGNTERITIDNPTRTRKWGWGWTNTPTGEDAYSIKVPSAPDYTGTLKQIFACIACDRTYASMKSGGTFTNTDWFYDGKRITNRREFGWWLDEYRMDMPISPVTIEVQCNEKEEE